MGLPKRLPHLFCVLEIRLLREVRVDAHRGGRVGVAEVALRGENVNARTVEDRGVNKSPFPSSAAKKKPSNGAFFVFWYHVLICEANCFHLNLVGNCWFISRRKHKK